MFTFLLYTVLYFLTGFAVAKLSKFYDTTYDITPRISYATLGIVWLPFYGLQVLIFVFSFIHTLFKEKI